MKLKAVSGIMLTLLLTFTLSTSTSMCQRNLVERWVPYIPYSADLKFWMSNGISYINVSMTFPDSGFHVSDWGTVVRDRGQIWVDSKIWDWTGYSFFWIITLSHTYDLGRLEEGNYTFTFKAWGIDVKSVSFTVPTTAAESIPTTEVFYDDGCQLFEQGIYVIATETNPVEMYQDYEFINDYYRMLKEHVTTEASTEDFISILVSRGRFSTGGYGLEIKSIEKMDYAFVLNASFTDPGPGAVTQMLTNPIALIPIGNLPAGEYSITLYIYRGCHDFIEETWTATFKCSEWITVTTPEVEMSIENKTTPLGDEIPIFMKTLTDGYSVGVDYLIFDVYLYDSNRSIFSQWSTRYPCPSLVWPTYLPSGFNETLHWNLYFYDRENYFPPPPGMYFLVGILMDLPRFVLGELLIKFNQSISPGIENGTVVTGIPSIDELNRQFGVYDIVFLFSGIYKLKLPKDAYIPSVAEIYNEDPNVEFAEPNCFYYITDWPVPYDDLNMTREPWDITPEILLIIDNKSITPIGLAEDQDTCGPDITNLIQDPKGDEIDPVPPYTNVKVSVNVSDPSGVQNVTLYYKTSTDAGETWSDWSDIEMNNTQGNTWRGEIPGFSDCTWVKYKIVAYDEINNEAIMDNAGEYFIYQVVPEFPTWTSMLLILIVLTFAIAIYKRRLLKTLIH